MLNGTKKANMPVFISWMVLPKERFLEWGGVYSQLALLRVLAIITEVDRAATASRQQGICGCFTGSADNRDALLVTGNQHPHMVWHPNLQ